MGGTSREWQGHQRRETRQVGIEKDGMLREGGV